MWRVRTGTSLLRVDPASRHPFACPGKLTVFSRMPSLIQKMKLPDAKRNEWFSMGGNTNISGSIEGLTGRASNNSIYTKKTMKAILY